MDKVDHSGADATKAAKRRQPVQRADPNSKPRPSILARVLLLFSLLVILDLWMVRHTGRGIQDFSVVVLVVGAIGGIAKLLKKPFRNEIEALGAQLDGAVRFLVRPAVLAVGATVVFLVIATFSSVVVMTEEGGEDPHVRIIPLDHPEATLSPHMNGDTRLVRASFVSTTPFGRTIRVEADGYVPNFFQLYPVTGLRLRLGVDLQPSPSVLIRPGGRVLQALADGASLRVWDVTNGRRRLIASTVGKQAAFLLGRRYPVSSDQRQEWQRQLTAQNLPPGVPATILGMWQDPISLPDSIALSPETILSIEVAYDGGPRVAMKELRLGTQTLVDVSLFAANP